MAKFSFYKNPVPLHTMVHKDTKVGRLNNDYRFAAGVNSVMLAGVEFAEAAKEYPVFFSKTEQDEIVAVAVLGLRNEENLYVNERGRWLARYLPAFVRRYPFILAQTEEGEESKVCIDEGFDGFEAPGGEALFTSEGEQSDYLKAAIEFLNEVQAQYRRTHALIQRLQEFDLLEPVTANITAQDGEKFSLSGMLMVKEERLLALPDNQAMQLFKNGELAWIYSHMLSVSNLNFLMTIREERDAISRAKQA